MFSTAMRSIILLLLLFASAFTVKAQTPEYELEARNFSFNHFAMDEIEFDVFIRLTNYGTVPYLEYAGGQFFFSYNPYIALHPGELELSIVGSDIPVNWRPRIVNGSVISNNDPKQYCLRLAINTYPGTGGGFIIPYTEYPGVKLFRLRIKRINGPFLSNNFTIRWRNFPPNNSNSRTRIYAYVGTTNTEITTPSTHMVDTSGINGSYLGEDPAQSLVRNYHQSSQILMSQLNANSFQYCINSDSSSSYSPYSLVKLSESFSGAEFPPEGWSVHSANTGAGTWYRPTFGARSNPACAESGFSPFAGDNYLITKRFYPSAGDSLVFYFRQLCTEQYQDSLEVLVSTRDSLPGSFKRRLLLLSDGISYPAIGTWKRIALDLTEFSGKTVWVAFRHADNDGETIKIDDVSVGRLPAKFTGITVYEPQDTVNIDEPFIIDARITNLGSESILQSFTIKLYITGAHSYEFEKRIDTLLYGQTKSIPFDTIYNFADTGSYSFNITSSIPSHKFLYSKKIYVAPRNWGRTNSGIWWANSEPGGFSFPYSRPDFFWADTAGSRSLILNGVLVSDLYIGSTYYGDIHTGYFNLKDLLGQNANNRCIRLNGISYTNFYPAVDGMIGLSTDTIPPANMNSPLPAFSGPSPAMYVFWGRLYYRANRLSRLSYKIDTLENLLVVTWDRVVQEHASDDHISFQAMIELKDMNNDTANSNFRFNYSDTTGGRTSSGFMMDYLNYGYGYYHYQDHIIGLNDSEANSVAYYRYRFGNSNMFPRRHRSGPLYQAPGKSSLSVEFGTDPANLTRLQNEYSLADVNADGIVDGTDLMLIDNDLGKEYRQSSSTDINKDGRTDLRDQIIAVQRALGYKSAINR